MREFLAAGHSVVGPEVHHDHLALELLDHVGQAGVFDDLEFDRVRGAGRTGRQEQAGEQGQENRTHATTPGNMGRPRRFPRRRRDALSFMVLEMPPGAQRFQGAWVMRYSVPLTRRPPGSPARIVWGVYASPLAVSASRSVDDGTRSWSVSRHSPP